MNQTEKPEQKNLKNRPAVPRLLPGFHPPTPGPDRIGPDSAYYRRIVFSALVSALLNLLFLWLLLVSDFSRLAWLKPAQSKPIVHRDPPRIVLQRQPPPPPKHTPAANPTFLETDESQKSQEKPKDAAFYSEHNTVATQKEATPVISEDIPKMDGQNTKTMATESVLPKKSAPPPTPPHETPPQEPKPAKPPEPEVAAKPNPTQGKPIEVPKKGDYALLNTSPPEPKTAPQPKPQESVKPEPKTPPPTPNNTQPGAGSQREVVAAMSKLSGGVRPTGKAYQFNSAESPFASYDKRIIGKIGTYWQYQVVEKFWGEKTGEVEISFKLMSDGRISALRVTRNTANAVLASWCLQAITQSSPFDPFPASMQALVGDYREGTITFAY